MAPNATVSSLATSNPVNMGYLGQYTTNSPQRQSYQEQYSYQYRQGYDNYHGQSGLNLSLQQLPSVSPPIGVTGPQTLQAYPDITSYVNSNPHQPAPTVDSVFNDQVTCPICGRNNFKLLKRHIKIHENNPRFRCRFPKLICNFKTNTYNRPFDYKRHLTNKHLKFDDKKVKKLLSLTNKLEYPGTCPCGQKFIAKFWLSRHILTDNANERCPLFSK